MKASETIGFNRHDHARCIEDSLEEAARVCREAGRDLTPGRRRVLEILLQKHRALGAYEILDRLRDGGRTAQPPVAYRALDFLVAQGLAHRVEKLNAFIACAHPGTDHDPAFLICRKCDRVAESTTRPDDRLGAAASDAGFAIEGTVVEALGLCPDCQA